MTVSDVMDLFADAGMQRVVLVDVKDGNAEEIFDGEYDDMSYEYQELEIMSIDNIWDTPDCHGKIVFNVDTSEME